MSEEQDGQYQNLWPRRVEALDTLSELIDNLFVQCRMSIIGIADGLLELPFAAFAKSTRCVTVWFSAAP